jgi:hypothetical protein
VIAALLVTLLVAAEDPPQCIDAVREIQRLDRHADAAIAAERCWRISRHPPALLIASQEWLNAGHHAHAAFTLDRFGELLESEAWARDTVPVLRNQILRNTGEVRVTFTPPLRPDEHVRFALERLGGPPRTPLTGSAPNLALRLDGGRWRMTLEREGYAATIQEITVTIRSAASFAIRSAPLAGPPALTLPLTATRITLGPARALRHGVTLQLRDADDPRARPLELAAPEPTLAVYLPPGRWQLQASARGYAKATTTFTASGPPVELRLRRGRTP